MEMLLYDFPLDRIDDIVVDEVMGYGTTLDEKILDIKRLHQLVVDQREQGAGLETHFEISPLSRRISPEEDSAIFVDEITVTMITDGDTSYAVRTKKSME